MAIARCIPPDATAGSACERFRALIRVNFTPREIGMLFGARTAYPEYATGGIDRLQRRCDAFVQAYLARQAPADKNALAGK